MGQVRKYTIGDVLEHYRMRGMNGRQPWAGRVRPARGERGDGQQGAAAKWTRQHRT